MSHITTTEEPHASPLRHSLLIGDLSEASLHRIGKLGRDRKLDTGEILFEQEDVSDAFYIIEEGSIGINILAPSGKKLSLNVMRPPDIFGEIGALDGGVRTATAVALAPSKVIKFDRNDILAEI